MGKLKITGLKSRIVYDSNCNQAFEIELTINDCIKSFGYAPRGSTQGGFECTQYYNNTGEENKLKFNNLFEKALILSSKLIGFEFDSFAEIDHLLLDIDGTNDKKNIAGNLMLAVSIAGLYGQAQALNLDPQKVLSADFTIAYDDPPSFMCNLIDGLKDCSTAGLECLLISNSIIDPQEQMETMQSVFKEMEKILIKEYSASPCISMQGGFCSHHIKSLEEILELACFAITKAGFTPGKDFSIGLDIAASDLMSDGRYLLPWKNNSVCNSLELIEYYKALINKYPICYLEDGLNAWDYDNWKVLQAELNQILIAGDDLFATNISRLLEFRSCANTAVVKPNQIGTISETIDFIKECKENNVKTVISQRTSEIECNLISHIAVGCNLDYIKAGGLRRMERISRYNEIIRLFN